MRHKIIIIGIVVSVLLLLIYLQLERLERAESQYEKFNQASLEGRISFLEASVGLVYIKIEEDSEKYAFMPLEIAPNQLGFYSIADLGDSIVKRPYSDTLKLIKNDKSYYYTFKDLGN
ncbi:hypothetical protein C900_00945 [Fulvivirga imtechensis AK7]|uniref:Uncharacterized protein n=1 Tax=Fulvivirga imtechensis AK7 TaxID=1237149 RepID=L8JL15_9BACT|nr:hypothetical protein [Fulvivirga imtechensis]ELR68107.1 hypothetical protein C900_00945 [Fulvivirga imtechensis AK7]